MWAWLAWSAAAMGAPATCGGDAAATAAAPVRLGAEAQADAWYAAAPCFADLGLPHVAERAWARGLDLDKDRRGAATALAEIAALTAYTADDTLLIDRAARLPPDLRSAEVSARLDVVAGMDLAKAGERWTGMEKLAAVPEASPMAGPARYRLGRLQWEVGQLDEARGSFQACLSATVDSPDAAERQWLERTRDLCTVALGHVQHAQGDDASARKTLEAVDRSSAIAWLAADGAAWYGSKKAAKVLKAHPDAFVPDMPLLLAGRLVGANQWQSAIDVLGHWDEAWGGAREALNGFLAEWAAKPSEAWPRWRAAPAHPAVAADVLLNGEVAGYTRSAGKLLAEAQKADALADAALATFVKGELAAARKDLDGRAGRALIDALVLRQERLETLASQSRRLREEELPAGASGAPPSDEKLRPMREPLSFLATDYGL